MPRHAALAHKLTSETLVDMKEFGCTNIGRRISIVSPTALSSALDHHPLAGGVMTSLIVAGIAVRTDAEGRYFLNDLHKAAGNERWHEPANWRITNSFKGLVAELETTGIPVVSIPGRNGGTYVVKELVYANAIWISPSFHLKVIRAYDALVTGNQLPTTAMPVVSFVGALTVGHWRDTARQKHRESVIKPEQPSG